MAARVGGGTRARGGVRRANRALSGTLANEWLVRWLRKLALGRAMVREANIIGLHIRKSEVSHNTKFVQNSRRHALGMWQAMYRFSAEV